MTTKVFQFLGGSAPYDPHFLGARGEALEALEALALPALPALPHPSTPKNRETTSYSLYC